MSLKPILTGGLILGLGILIGYYPGQSFPHSSQTTTDTYSTRALARTYEIPIIDFEDVPISDAIDYLRSLTRTPVEIEGGPEYQQLNFVLQDATTSARHLNLILRDIPLDRLCELIAEDSGLDLSFGEHAIVFSAPTHQAEQAETLKP